MKRIFWLIGIAAAVWGLPRLSHPAVDVGKLEPVEAVLLTFGGSGVEVETDTGAKGHGPSLQDAVEDLRRGAETQVFLDTAGKLLISGEAGENWNEIYTLFRPSCLVCKAEGDVDLKTAAAYLAVHKPEMNLNRLRTGASSWQVFRIEEGRGCLEPE